MCARNSLFNCRKCIWKHRLRNGGYFVRGWGVRGCGCVCVCVCVGGGGIGHLPKSVHCCSNGGGTQVQKIRVHSAKCGVNSFVWEDSARAKGCNQRDVPRGRQESHGFAHHAAEEPNDGIQVLSLRPGFNSRLKTWYLGVRMRGCVRDHLIHTI